MTEIGPHSSQGEMKRGLAELAGEDPSRYAETTGNERHKHVLTDEMRGAAEALGLGFLEERQECIDAIMLKLGRDHRVGERHLDSSDLLAIIRAIEERQGVVADGDA